MVKQRVRQGYYSPDRPLPSVRALREEFDVSLTVIQKAMRYLEEDGVVLAHHGKNITLVPDSTCEQTALLFGFIYPFAGSLVFHRDVLDFADQAFADRYNFAVVRSSNDDPVREREIAEHFVANGVKGLILWPASNDPNGPFFEELARSYPVVLVDRTLPAANLPAVTHDTRAIGADIIATLLEKKRKQRLLVIVDNLKITPYKDLVQGMQEQATELGRMADVTVVYLPITKAIEDLSGGDFKLVDACHKQVERMVHEGGYDALFCTQDDFIEFAMIDTAMIDAFPQMQLATLKPVGGTMKSRKYHQHEPIKWLINSGEVVSKAADLLQRWLLSRKKPKAIQMPCLFESPQ